jgi:SdiA-regulated
MKNVFIILLSILLIPCFFLNACKVSNKKNKTPVGYDLNNPEKMIMPGSLLEISGICFYKGNSDTIYAIQDEDGKVFHLAWGNKKNHNTKFGKKGDYEDVAIVNENIFVLKSDGTLFSFAKKETDLDEPGRVNEWKELLPRGEYEGMYGDEAAGKLYILCKSCIADDKDKKVVGYIYEVRDSVMLSSGFSIDVGEIRSLAKKGSIGRSGFLPSGLAKNPLTGEWFILSAYNKLLVITDSAWKVKDVYPLNGNTFNQAEGIAFDSKGNLYISNEGDDETNGNVLLFKRK